MDNLKLAHKRAREDKSYYKEVKMVDKNPDYYFKQIEGMLVSKTYTMTPDDYKMMKKNDRGKERNLYVLDYFPHRIIQHALLIQIEDIIFRNLIETTYSSLPTRGIHKALKEITYDLRNDVENTQFCLQMDIKKFYPNINHEINKQQYRKIFKDDDLLWLIDTIIDSLCLDDNGLKVELEELLDELMLIGHEKGIAIGSVFSQWDGNFNLSEFDHWLKEEKKVKYYYRYCDDLIILASNKEELHEIRKDIQIYLKEKLKLDLKGNYKVYPVDIQGIDFVGYRHFRTYILLRKSTSKRLIRKMRDIQNKIDNSGEFDYSDYCSINGYMGWIRWCNGHNLHVKWIEPLMPYYKKYYEEAIKGENNTKRKRHSKIYTEH